MSTIASIVTALGEAAVSIIRISGPDSWAIVKKLINHEDINFKPGTFKLAWIFNEDKKLDQVLLLFFKAPHSYTGEDVIEIHAHGGIWLSQQILNLVLEQGAILAKPGEFTERAFLNGKVDLSQAEAVADIISARSYLAGENAVKLYQGFLGEEIFKIRSALIDLLGEIIAGIDFPDEVGDYDKNKFQEITQNLIANIDNLLAGEQEGHILRYGYKIAIIGEPNVGKSTLLNTLLKSERAIVTEIAGTTRDVLEESYSIRGVPVILLDTAGIRESDDSVERIGIERTMKAVQEADLVLLLEDLSPVRELVYKSNIKLGKNTAVETNPLRKLIENKNSLIVGTKLDLADDERLVSSINANQSSLSVSSEMQLLSKKAQHIKNNIEISALRNVNIEKLKDLIYSRIVDKSHLNQIKINHRQADLLRKAKVALIKALESTEKNLAQDFWTIDLKAAVTALGEITGDVVTEELLDNIFRNFCIGK